MTHKLKLATLVCDVQPAAAANWIDDQRHSGCTPFPPSTRQRAVVRQVGHACGRALGCRMHGQSCGQNLPGATATDALPLLTVHVSGAYCAPDAPRAPPLRPQFGWFSMPHVELTVGLRLRVPAAAEALLSESTQAVLQDRLSTVRRLPHCMGAPAAVGVPDSLLSPSTCVDRL